ncbi:MAG: zinc-dependent metalloprotease [Candidatus Eremiobacteraeota bacterium]|nr:zinc-dependent metalloprotease [Candidatus Eremiobacteraeota bacterium]
MNVARIVCIAVLLAGITGSGAMAQTPPAPAPAPSGVPVPAGVSDLSQLRGLIPGLGGPGAAASPQAYAAFTRTVERQTGTIDILHKDDEVYFDLGDAQLGHPFIIAPVLAGGVGEGAFAGRIFNPFVVEFKKVGKRIFWVSKNTAFFAQPNTPAAVALAISTTDSVINSSPIVAQDDTKKRYVISAGFFLTDFENVGRSLGGGGGLPVLILGGAVRPGFSVDSSRSYIEKTKTLPKNDELLVNLAFTGPPNGPAAAPDGRGVRIHMHYSIVDAPTNDHYVPRLADDRVGYFLTALKHFDDDSQTSAFERYIDRWNFNNGPIVYYLTNEIPAQYKPAIRAGLLEWNKAFAKAGVPNAIEVRDQPVDAAWDPDDSRYSTVRWITSDRPGFSAYGPHVADPRNGEIIRVEIVIDGENMRAVKRGYVEQITPTRQAAMRTAGDELRYVQQLVNGANPLMQCDDLSACDNFSEESAEYASVGTLALMANGASKAMTEKYAEDYLQSVVLHEAGHNFGLRHNFAAAIYPLAKLHDKNFTATHGLVNSVMHYTPVNLSPPGKPQGDYFQMRLGPYDYWAIEYGYGKTGAKSPAEEASQLKRIASQSTRPELVYATDEDSSGPRGVDPHVGTYLLSSDPFAFYQNQFQVFDDLIARLDKVYPRDDRPYSEERQAFMGMMRQYNRAAGLATKYVGGLYTSRSHRGQPGGVSPFRNVSRDDQRRAFATLSENVFSAKSFNFPPQMLANLGAQNYLHRGLDASAFGRPDFPVADYIAGLQDTVMFELLSPDTMSRIVDAQLRSADRKNSMSLPDLFGWMQASVWNDVNPNVSNVNTVRRGLQRRYTSYIIAISLAPSFLLDAIGYPSDTASLARFQLRRLDERLATGLKSRQLDVATRAHLEDTRSRVRHALDPSASRGA